MGARAVAAVRDWNERLGPDATYAIVEPRRPDPGDPGRCPRAGLRRLPAAGRSARARSASSATARVAPRSSGSTTPGSDPTDLVPTKRKVRSARGPATRDGPRGPSRPDVVESGHVPPRLHLRWSRPLRRRHGRRARRPDVLPPGQEGRRRRQRRPREDPGGGPRPAARCAPRHPGRPRRRERPGRSRPGQGG